MLDNLGVPSYRATYLENTNDHYILAPEPNPAPAWRAVAVRGNHSYDDHASDDAPRPALI